MLRLRSKIASNPRREVGYLEFQRATEQTKLTPSSLRFDEAQRERGASSSSVMGVFLCSNDEEIPEPLLAGTVKSEHVAPEGTWPLMSAQKARVQLQSWKAQIRRIEQVNCIRQRLARVLE